jgi:hypothetical protein
MCQIIYVRVVLPGRIAGLVGLALAIAPAMARASEPALPPIVFELPPDSIVFGLAPEAAPPATSNGVSPAWARACSFRHPLCVVAAPGTDDHVTLAALDAADRAWETLTQTLAVPEPDGASGSPWQLFLVDGVEGGGTAQATGRDPIAHFDRVTSVGLVDRRSPSGCALDLAVARAVARGSLWRASPSTDAGSAIAESESLARLATPCRTGAEDLHAFQSHPQDAIADPSTPSSARGASAFFDWLDVQFASQAPHPGSIVSAVWALSATQSPFGALTWSPKPTGFDVLRASLKGALSTDSTLDDVLVRFAVDRTRMSPRAALALETPWPASPRSFVASDPPSPTGASYISVGHAGARPGKLRFIAHWESYARMHWSVVKVGRSGETLAVLDVTSPPRATSAAMVVEDLDEVDHLLLVGVNLGRTDYPFDPARGGWSSHGWLLTLESG